MVLNSLQFAGWFLIFLAVLLIVPKNLRKIWLLAGNCAFYLSHERWYFVLLLLSALMIWLCGIFLENTGGRRKKIFLILPVIWNAGLLIFFKYTGLIDNIFTRTGITFSIRDLLPPLGISFYTLRSVSYITNVSRGKLNAVQNPFDVIIYVSFFPQIISGPIEKPSDFFRELKKFETEKRHSFERIFQGFLLFVWGLFQKIVLAERLSFITTHFFGNFQNHGFWELLFASLAYTFQIYCDFSGYSDMSRGIAAMMGFSTMRNFLQPYLAVGIREFWRRWHISLTGWLTENIYIPLGGSRKGTLRRYINILVVFIISGLWHGSTLNFLFWGALHAVYQIIEDLFRRKGWKLKGPAGWVVTFAEVNFAWIFFNAGGLNRGFRIIRQMFTRFDFPAVFDPGLSAGNLTVLGCGLVLFFLVDFLHEKRIPIMQKTAALPLPLRFLIYLGLFWSVIMLGIYGIGYDTTGFIYARF